MLVIALVGLAIVSATVLLHVSGTTWWLQRLRNRSRGATQIVKRSALFSVLLKTALVLISLHVVEVFLWALTFQFLPDNGLASLEECMYFSFVTFTTLGYGDITLAEPWRLLTGIEALNGVLLLGWSTAISFAVIQRVWEQDTQNS